MGRGRGRGPLGTSPTEPASACRGGLPRCPRRHRRSRGPSSRPLGLTCSGTAWCPPATCSWRAGCTPARGPARPGTCLFGCRRCKRPRHSARNERAPSRSPCALSRRWWTGRSSGGRSVAAWRPQARWRGDMSHRGPC